MTTLDEIAQQLRQEADRELFQPWQGKPPSHANRRDFEIQNSPIRVQFTRTEFGSLQIYQLSVSSPLELPEMLLQQICRAFFREEEYIEFPSIMGNCRQFICEIKD